MKQSEIRVCDGCKGELVGPVDTGKAGVFYKISIATFVPDPKAIRERLGLQIGFGFPVALADIFAPSPEVALEVEAVGRSVLVCFDCYIKVPVAEIEAPKQEESTGTAGRG